MVVEYKIADFGWVRFYLVRPLGGAARLRGRPPCHPASPPCLSRRVCSSTPPTPHSQHTHHPKPALQAPKIEEDEDMEGAV